MLDVRQQRFALIAHEALGSPLWIAGPETVLGVRSRSDMQSDREAPLSSRRRTRLPALARMGVLEAAVAKSTAAVP
jgi:hypothetical protein